MSSGIFEEKHNKENRKKPSMSGININIFV